MGSKEPASPDCSSVVRLPGEVRRHASPTEALNPGGNNGSYKSQMRLIVTDQLVKGEALTCHIPYCNRGSNEKCGEVTIDDVKEQHRVYYRR